MILQHGRCRGLRLFHWGRHQLEVWWAPGGTVIQSHYHNFVHSTIIPLGGKARGTIGKRSGWLGWTDVGRRFLVPAGTAHSANVTGRFFLFANWETWRDASFLEAFKSAAVDFELT